MRHQNTDALLYGLDDRSLDPVIGGESLHPFEDRWMVCDDELTILLNRFFDDVLGNIQADEHSPNSCLPFPDQKAHIVVGLGPGCGHPFMQLFFYFTDGHDHAELNVMIVRLSNVDILRSLACH